MRPRTIRIFSENNDFQHAEVLRRNREKRQKHKEFFVEGVKAIELALANDWQVTALLYAHDRSLSDWAERMLSESKAERHLELPFLLMQKLSDKNETSELLALVRMPEDRLDRIELKVPLLVVVLDRPSSPGNLGTTLRACDCLGVDGVVMTGHAADLYDPKTIRASIGTLFSRPVVRLPSSKDLEPWLQTQKRERHAQIIGTSASASLTIADHDFAGPSIVVFGNESSGLSAHYRSLCDAQVTIPIRGAASSLNVASAAAITLYEVDRQRRLAGVS